MKKKFAQRIENYILLLWFALNLCLGFLLVHDFGISSDEWSYFIYARNSVDAYKSFFTIAYAPNLGPSFMPYYGPAFVIFPELAARSIRWIAPNIFTVDVWHFCYFLVFQLGGLCLFSLARRWFNSWSAWGILLLYTSQPILWGHAFINPKDIPFMAFFLFSLWGGLRLADSLGATDAYVSLQSGTDLWKSIDAAKRLRFLKWVKIESWIFLVLAALTFPLKHLAEILITFLYAADPNSTMGILFQYIAPQTTNIPVNDYVIKAQSLLLRMEFMLLLIGVLLTLVHLLWISIDTKKRPRVVWGNRTFRLDLAELVSLLRNPKVVLAGALLGMTTSIRVLGPLAGLIIIIHLAFAFRKRALTIIPAYLFYAGIATYLTWPYLWSNPFTHFVESLMVMSNYPWTGRVLYNGSFYQPDQLPISYLPLLFNIQLTEPLLVLMYLGFIALIRLFIHNRLRWDLLLVLMLGAILPLAGLIISRTTMYDNFRQILFILPLLMLLTGIALDLVFSALNHTVIRLALLISLAFPGIYAIMHLHPYEYVYYNSLIGGVSGAYRRFELDYWVTSYREAAEWLNVHAPAGANIRADGDLMEFYLRSDLNLHPQFSGNTDQYDYAVSTTRYNLDLTSYPYAKTVYSIQRDGAVLTVIKNP